MCKVCAAILDRLIQKGLVSEGNVKMCAEEIERDLERIVANTNPVELDMIIRHDKKGGFDA